MDMERRMEVEVRRWIEIWRDGWWDEEMDGEKMEGRREENGRSDG